MVNRPKPVVLLILDGFGYSLGKEYNAVAMVNIPCWNQLQKDWFMTLLLYPGNVLICNYANCGIVGHIGIMVMPILVVRVAEASFQCIVDALKSVGRQMLITAGDGNIEQMINKKNGLPHITNQVLWGYVGGDKALDISCILSGLAPAVLAMSGVEQSVEMTSWSLI